MDNEPKTFLLHGHFCYFDNENIETAKEALSELWLWLTGTYNEATKTIDFFGNAHPNENVTRVTLEEDLWIEVDYSIDLNMGNDGGVTYFRLIKSNHTNDLVQHKTERIQKKRSIFYLHVFFYC
jgi:hypothetical protein